MQTRPWPQAVALQAVTWFSTHRSRVNCGSSGEAAYKMRRSAYKVWRDAGFKGQDARPSPREEWYREMFRLQVRVQVWVRVQVQVQVRGRGGGEI